MTSMGEHEARIANLEGAVYDLQRYVEAQQCRILSLESALLPHQTATAAPQPTPAAEPEADDPECHEEPTDDAVTAVTAVTAMAPGWVQNIVAANPTARYVRKEDLAEALCMRKGVPPHPHIGSVRWRVPSGAGAGVALKVIPHILERAAAVYGLVIEATGEDIVFSDEFMDGSARSFEVYVAYSIKGGSDVKLRNGAVMARKAGHPAVDIVHLDACTFDADKPDGYVVITVDEDSRALLARATFFNQVSASLETRLGLLCHSHAYAWEERSIAFDVWSPDGALPTAEKVHDALWHIAGVRSVSFEAAGKA